jgi:hypothetical protein
VRVRTMLALAEHVGIDLDLLEHLRTRAEHHLGLIDSAEPPRRAELERLVAVDFDELAGAYKLLKRMVERGGEA